MSSLRGKRITKRNFLKILGLSSTSLLGTFPGFDAVSTLNSGPCYVYHTSSRKRRACNACKSHAANRIYPSRDLADLNRAHPGCNCRIVKEEIGWQDYVKAFWHSSRGGAAVYDRRWGWPPPSPPGFNQICGKNLDFYR
jgi:hypothetical protein